MSSPEIPVRIITPADHDASIARCKAGLAVAAEEIIWQVEMETWKVKGYRSWDAFREATYGGPAVIVPTGSRKAIVEKLRPLLTQQETADTLGVTARTIKRDEAKVTNVPSAPPEEIRAEAERRTAEIKANLQAISDEYADLIDEAVLSGIPTTEVALTLMNNMQFAKYADVFNGTLRTAVFEPLVKYTLEVGPALEAAEHMHKECTPHVRDVLISALRGTLPADDEKTAAEQPLDDGRR